MYSRYGQTKPMDPALKKQLNDRNIELSRSHGFSLSVSSVDAFLRLETGDYRRLQRGVAAGMTAVLETLIKLSLAALAAALAKAPAPRCTVALVSSVVRPLFGVPPGHKLKAVPQSHPIAPNDEEGKTVGNLGDGIQAISRALGLENDPTPLALDPDAIAELSSLVLLEAELIFYRTHLLCDHMRRKTIFCRDLHLALLKSPSALASDVAHAVRRASDAAMFLGGADSDSDPDLGEGGSAGAGDVPALAQERTDRGLEGRHDVQEIHGVVDLSVPGWSYRNLSYLHVVEGDAKEVGILQMRNTAELLLRSFEKLRVGACAPVYLAAVMEYLMAELIEIALKEASKDARGDGSAEEAAAPAAVQLEPKHVLQAIYNDEELEACFKTHTGITFSTDESLAFHGLQIAEGDGNDGSAGGAGDPAADGGAATGTGERGGKHPNNFAVDTDGCPDRLAGAFEMVLKQICPAAIVSPATRSLIAALVDIVGALIAKLASTLAIVCGRKTISSREIQSAVRLFLRSEVGDELAKHAVSEGTKAVTKFSCCW